MSSLPNKDQISLTQEVLEYVKPEYHENALNIIEKLSNISLKNEIKIKTNTHNNANNNTNDDNNSNNNLEDNNNSLTQEHQFPEKVHYPLFQPGYVYAPSLTSNSTSTSTSLSYSHRPNDPVKHKLKLEYIYGWSKKGCRGNILLPTNDGRHLIYPAAACTVVFSLIDGSSQQIHSGHSDDCVCIDVHPTSNITVTGQIGPENIANIQVWDHESMETLARWAPQGISSGGIIDVSFAPSFNDGRCLAVIGGSDYKSVLMIYDWKAGKQLVHMPAARSKVFMIKFINQETVVLATSRGIKVAHINIQEPNKSKIRNAIISHDGKMQTAYSIAYKDDHFICGMQDGSLYIFESNKLISTRKNVHQGSVWTVFANNNMVISGGKDATLKIWRFTDDRHSLPSIQCQQSFHFSSGIRTVSLNCPSLKDNNNNNNNQEKAYIGFINGDMIELNLSSSLTGNKSSPKDIKQPSSISSSSSLSYRTLMMGHSGKGELWGLTTSQVHRKEHDASGWIFLSAADDGGIYIWDLETKRCLDHQHFEETRFRSITSNANHFTSSTFSKSESSSSYSDSSSSSSSIRYAAGTWEGTVMIFDEDLNIVTKLQDGSQEIAAITFSPDGNYLSVGSHDGCIYIHSTDNNSQYNNNNLNNLNNNNNNNNNGYNIIGTLEGHSSYITHVDWSSDGRYLQSVDGAHELLYWDFESMERISAPIKMRNIDWYCPTCPLGWSVRGVWESSMDGTDVNDCAVHKDRALLAAADDFGQVNLLNYPTLIENPPKLKYTGHCSHVTKVQFTPDHHSLLSAGGSDLTVMQWKII